MSRWHKPDPPDWPDPHGPKLEGPTLSSQIRHKIMKKWAANQPLSEQDMAALLWIKEREKAPYLVRNEKGIQKLLRSLETYMFDAIGRLDAWAHDSGYKNKTTGKNYG